MKSGMKIYMLLVLLIIGLGFTNSTNAQRGRARRRAIDNSVPDGPVRIKARSSAAIDNTIADGPQRVRARGRARTAQQTPQPPVNGVTVMDNEAGIKSRRPTQGVTVTDDEARLRANRPTQVVTVLDNEAKLNVRGQAGSSSRTRSPRRRRAATH